MTFRNPAQDERQTRDLLLVAYHFPPHMTPHSLRWYHLSRELAGLGYTIDVVTSRMPQRFQDDFFKPHRNVAVHRTFPGLFFDSTFRLSREKIPKDVTSSAEAPDPGWMKLQKIHGATLRLLNTLFIPDAYGEWLPFAVARALTLSKRYRYRFVISTSEPRVGHLVGWWVKRATALPWIADYGDPWIYPVGHSYEPEWKKHLLQKIEGRILRDVDALTLAARGIGRIYRERYPGLCDRPMRVVAQGYDSDLMSTLPPLGHSGFRLVYCGSLYPKLRDPRAVFQAVQSIEANDFQWLIAGRINEFSEMVRRPLLQDRILHTGFVHHRTALSLEKGATVLLHIANASDVQVPGKIYEYLGAARPILVVTDNCQDPAARLVLRMNRGLVVANRPACIRKALQELLQLWRQDQLNHRFDLGIVTDCSWKARVQGFHSLLEEIPAS